MRKLLLSLLVLLGVAAPVRSAVTFSQVASHQVNALSTSFTFSMTVTAGTDRAMFVGFCTANGLANEVTAITFDGVPLTLVADISTISSGAHAYLYRLLSPNVVAGEVAVTLTNGRRTAGGAIVLHGVHQTTPTDGTQTNSNNADTTSVSVTVTTDTGDMIVDVGCKRDNNPGLTMGAQTNRTERYNLPSTFTTESSNIVAGGSTRTGTGALTMNWTGTDNIDRAMVGTNVNAAVAAPVGRLSVGFHLLR